MKNIKKILLALVDVVLFLLCFECDARRDAVDVGLLDYSGQGRNSYGK